jgi:hypothetical protein
LATLVAAFLAIPASAQTYTIINNSGVGFEDITGSGTQIGPFSNYDDAVVSGNPIGFSFTFYGAPFTTVNISTNGNAQFGGTNTSFTNTNLLTNNTPSGSHWIAPFWDDLDASNATFTPPNGEVFIQTLGSVGSRRFIMQWNRWGHNDDGGTGVFGDDITFEIKLNEGSNSIDFVYADANFPFAPSDNGLSATVAISPGPFNDGTRPVAQFSFNTASLSNGQSISFVLSTIPEPATLLLGAVGLCGAGLVAQRRRRRAKRSAAAKK